MRFIKILIGAALLWSLYWFAAGYGLRSSIGGWFAAQADRGWQAEFSEISGSGYPVTHATTLRNPALADPASGAAWRADWLVIESPAIWPGRQTLSFPATPMRLSYLDQTVVVTGANLHARLFLAPGQALEMEELALEAQDWLITDESGPVVAAQSLKLSMTQGDTPQNYRLEIDAPGFAPGLALRRLIASAEALPDSFETLHLDMTVTFDRPWDRKALEQSRPQPRQIDLKLADAHWGALRLRAAGVLTVDEQGLPTGSITLKADNWREMLQMAQSAQVLSAQAVQGAERVLTLFAGLGGDPDALEIKLNFRDGTIALGPLPVGPAPRIILR